MLRKRATLLLAGALICAPLALAQEAGMTRISQFSGKPVPRFEVLKYNAVNGRKGPSSDHPVEWKYAMKGLPVLIIKESPNWRRVIDPSGAEVWMHARTMEEGHNVLIREDVMLKTSPEPTSEDAAFFGQNVLASLLDCEGTWCLVTAKGQKGWAPKHLLWGADATEAGL